MKALAIILGCASAAWAAEPGALTTVHAIRALSRAEAAKGLSVAFEGTVTYYARPDTSGASDIDLFVQDGNEAIYVETKPNQDLALGDRVLVRGITRDSFRTDVVSESVVRLHPGEPPKPVPAGYGQLVRAELDCMRVTVRATVRSADRVSFGNLPGIDLKLLMDGGYIDATAIGSAAIRLKEMLDAEVEVTGVAAGIFDSKNQLTGIVLEVPSLADIKILKRAQAGPDSLPVTPMDEVLSAYFVQDQTHRVRVQGTITYYQPGSAVVLQNGAKSLWVMTQFEGPLRVGDWADATGFPEVNGAVLTLARAEIQDSQLPSPLAPRQVSGAELASGTQAFDLVSIEGRVLMSAREAAQDEYVLVADDKVFSAIYRHPEIAGAGLPPMRHAAAGSTVRVTGICMLQYGSDPFHGPVAVDVLLRSFDDIAVVARPTWFSVRNLGIASGILFILVLAAGARGWTLERQMRRQTAELAYIERRRSRILEDINGTRPLAEIIEQITELVSFKLKGSPCWCQIAEGALLGNCPPKLDAFRIVQEEIPGRSGTAHGAIFAGLDPLTSPQAIEREALKMATALSALAMETRRIYTDLRRRSEFDLLTDTHNRFSMDKHLDTLIEESRQTAGIFGLIYIDLNEFKQINDLYGHQVGDRYLQEVALRMKRQLRSHDLLARLGGDEFAALVPVVRSRAEVEEIAQRLERSFDEPFTIERYTIQGSASVGIAMYPKDGSTKDSLLNTADAAMYLAKNSARQLD
ncbi:MAG TPA: GGDEF domain-containing protein [Terracidiphilus sp.]|nr:GGDEF domain-containing protein [Terracidiphilus sp.]